MTQMPCGSMKILPSASPWRADRPAEIVVRAEEPLAIPAVARARSRHRGSAAYSTPRPRRRAVRDVGQLAGREHEKPGDEHRLGDACLPVGGGLEGLARHVGETIEIQAVVPVGAADERQTVRPEPVERVLEAALQVLLQRRFGAGLIIEGHGFVEDRPSRRSPLDSGDADISQCGSSLNPPPTSLLPRLVRG